MDSQAVASRRVASVRARIEYARNCDRPASADPDETLDADYGAFLSVLNRLRRLIDMFPASFEVPLPARAPEFEPQAVAALAVEIRRLAGRVAADREFLAREIDELRRFVSRIEGPQSEGYVEELDALVRLLDDPEGPFAQVERSSLELAFLETGALVVQQQDGDSEPLSRSTDAIAAVSQNDTWARKSAAAKHIRDADEALRVRLEPLDVAFGRLSALRQQLAAHRSGASASWCIGLEQRAAVWQSHLERRSASLLNARRRLEEALVKLHQSDMRSLFAAVLDHLKRPPESGGLIYSLLTIAGAFYVLTLSFKAGLGFELASSIVSLQAFLVLGFVYAAPSLLVMILAAAFYAGVHRRIARDPKRTAEVDRSTWADVRAARDAVPRVNWTFKRAAQLAVLLGWIFAILAVPPALAFVRLLEGEALTIGLDDGHVISDVHHLFSNGDYSWYYRTLEDTSGGKAEDVFKLHHANVRCVHAGRSVSDGRSASAKTETAQAKALILVLDEPSGEGRGRDKRVVAVPGHCLPASEVNVAGAVMALNASFERLEQAVATLSLGGEDGEAPPFRREFLACAAKSRPAMSVFFPTGSDRPSGYAVGSTSAEGAKALAAGDASPVLSEMEAIASSDAEVFLIGLASNAGSISENFQLAEKRVERVAEIFAETSYSMRYLPFGEQWSRAYLQHDASPPTVARDDPDARAVHIYVCGEGDMQASIAATR